MLIAAYFAVIIGVIRRTFCGERSVPWPMLAQGTRVETRESRKHAVKVELID
jgi:hypothetical protein